MKQLLAASLVGALVSMGCGSGSAGGPGATKDNRDNSPHLGTSEGTFTLSVPTIQNRMKQGDTNQYTIGISRGKNFDQDVAVKLEGLPKGVTMEPASPMIKASEKETKVTFKAANDAAIGEYTIKVTGHPSIGPDATNQFTLHIDKK